MNPLRADARAGRSGVALIVVLVLLAMMLIYLVAAQGSVQTSFTQDRVTRDRLERAQMERAALARLARADAPASGTLTWPADEAGTETLRLDYLRRPLPPGDPLYKALDWLEPRPGDATAVLEWGGDEPARPRQFLINTEGRRRGAVEWPPRP